LGKAHRAGVPGKFALVLDQDQRRVLHDLKARDEVR
jgi:hypothetical protein